MRKEKEMRREYWNWQVESDFKKAFAGTNEGRSKRDQVEKKLSELVRMNDKQIEKGKKLLKLSSRRQ